MLKYLLLGLLVIWLLYSPILKRMRQRHRDDRSATPPPRPSPPSGSPVEDMVACAHCGIHLPAGEAVRDAANRPYCGVPHRDAGPLPR